MVTKHRENGIALHYNAPNRLADIEILDAAQRLDNPETLKQVVLEKNARREIENQIAAG